MKLSEPITVNLNISGNHIINDKNLTYRSNRSRSDPLNDCTGEVVLFVTSASNFAQVFFDNDVNINSHDIQEIEQLNELIDRQRE